MPILPDLSSLWIYAWCPPSSIDGYSLHCFLRRVNNTYCRLCYNEGMPVKTYLNPDKKLLCAKCFGKVLFEDCKSALVEAMADAMYSPDFCQFIDLSNAQYVPAIQDFSDAYKLTSQMRDTLKGKIAIVTSSRPTFTIAKAIKQLAKKNGVTLDAFMAIDAAMTWLKATRTPNVDEDFL